jgi:hypothetical protein
MNSIDWSAEHRRFQAVAYVATQRAARRAFWSWRSNKRDDAIQECHAKMWDQWSRLRLRGKNPETMLGSLIKFAILWVRYDRRLGGRAPTPDVFDYRSGLARQQLSDQGVASPTDRADADNAWIDWHPTSGDDPCELAAALETYGTTLTQWCDC